MATKTRKCCRCKQRQDAGSMLILPAGAFCNMDHAVTYSRERGRKALESRRRKESREARAESRESAKAKREARAEDLPHQLTLTRLSVNKLVRLLDHGKECISCGEYRELEAGHYRGVGAMPSLRFDLRNIYGQCRPCNGSGTMSYKRGKNPAVVSIEYQKRLRVRMGDALVDWLNGPHPVRNWTCDELRGIRKEADAEIRRLERGEQPSRDWRAVPLPVQE